MNKSELIHYQAHNTWKALQVGLKNYDIEYGVDYTGISVHNSVMLITYTLNMINTNKWRTLNGLVSELSQMAQLGDNGKARVDYDGLRYLIEIPKPKHLHDTVDLGQIFNSAKGLNVALGVSTKDNKPALMDFTHDTSGHMMVSGMTRCGKTNILKIIAMLLMYKTSPDNTRIAIIDTVKAEGEYGMLRNSAHLATDLIDTEPKAVAFLNWVKDTIVNLSGRKYSHKVFIIIDEVYLLFQNKKIAPILRYIASAGAGAGFHLIPATQYTKVDDVGGPQFKGNMISSMTGRVKTHHDSLNATGKSGMGAENLMVPGDFLLVTQEGTKRVAVPHIMPKFFDKIERGMTPVAKINWTEEEVNQMPGTVGHTPSMAACFDKVDERLLHLAINGRHKNGKPFGADVIRKASTIMAKKGMGKSIGNSVANEYVKFAKRYRQIK